MKICVAQTRPITGDIQQNIAHHQQMIALAVSHGADMIIFPELSLMGYEPELAKTLAIDIDDSRLDEMQALADKHDIMIGVGAAIKTSTLPFISIIFLRPRQQRLVYSKQYLHEDEEPFFSPGNPMDPLIDQANKIALAICYEISVTQHAEDAAKSGASIYIASVAKSVPGTKKALERLSGIAKEYSMMVLFSNYTGQCEDYACGGMTSILDRTGVLLGQLDDSREGLLILDTRTSELIAQTIN